MVKSDNLHPKIPLFKNGLRKPKFQIALLALFLILIAGGFSTSLQAQTAAPPIITKQPVASSTHAKEAKIMLYVQALPAMQVH